MVRCDLRTDTQETCVLKRLGDLCDQNLSTILGSIVNLSEGSIHDQFGDLEIMRTTLQP